MAISPGQRLGPYEVLSAIGAGGMGEVYRARDTRLDRIVAVKILPEHHASNPEFRERFEREAHAVAALNHPHICVLHDIGHQNGTDYLVMEYLEGETLAQRLTKGALPLDQVLKYAIEIADALDKAHRKGITHRDLKPGNIMLTKSGAKLLDFGLAKLRQDASLSQVPLSQLSTKDPITEQGVILGTLQYMAPEQVEGKVVDARTDVFAFGAVVYEMATGNKAFEGQSQASLIAKILETDPPPISSLQPMTPPALDRVVKKCLYKNPDDRWQSARDMGDELKWIAEGTLQASVASSVKGNRWFERHLLFVGLSAFLFGAAIASLAAWNLKPTPPPQPVTRTVINLPPGQQLGALEVGPAVALSADGTQLAYVGRQGSTRQIYLRRMDSLEAKPVPDTNGAEAPFFSPDGQWVGFFAGGKLKKVSVSGGSALTLGDAPTSFGASWGSNEIIAFSPMTGSALLQVSDAGGAHPLLRDESAAVVAQRWPELLPGGKAVLLVAGTSGITFTNARVAVQSLGTGEQRNLIQGGTYPRYSSSGHLVYAQAGSLMAVPFDPQRLAVTGVAVPVVDGILQYAVSGAAQYSLSANGSLVYVSGGVQSAQRRLVWVSRSGAEQPLPAPAHGYATPRLSPDGRRVAVSVTEEDSQVWLYDLTRETSTPFTFEGNLNYNPIWTPDGKRIAFTSNKEKLLNVFWQLADGNGGLERLTSSEYLQAPTSWSPDGILAFVELNPTTQRDIWMLQVHERKAHPFLRTQSDEAVPEFSPDGRWLAYSSNVSGRYEVYIEPYPGPGGKHQISTEGGTEPVWNRNGKELFYRSGDKMMSVDIATQSGFAAGTPRMLFEGPYEPAPYPISNYDVSPDGQRFLMVKPTEQAEVAPTQINVVQNWFEELNQKVPPGKK